MMVPTIHLNGTGKTSLLEELRAALDALDKAYDALRQVTVHGRDYYVQGPDAYKQARHEMDARLVKLAEVQADVIEMAQQIQRQQGREDRRTS